MNTFYLIVVMITGVIIIYHFFIRPKLLRIGVTKKEALRRFPGDEIIPPKPFRSTLAARLDASPEEIWPWLVQIGWGRAAFYSYNGIEKLFKMNLHNADHIHPEWQDVRVGDTMWMSHPNRQYLFPMNRVEIINPPKELVFALYAPEDADTRPSGAWSFILEPVDEKSTRLFSRLQLVPHSIFEKLFIYFFMEPAHIIMQMGMFKGIQKRLVPQKSEQAEHVPV